MNDIYNIFGGFDNFQKRFNDFKQNLNMQNPNMNPQQKVQELLNSGRMTQQQFERIRSLANLITGKNF